MNLATLLCERPARLACVHRDGERSVAELADRAAAVAARVRADGGGAWLLHCEDAFAFAVALFGVAHGGGVARLLPNRQPGTLEAAAGSARGLWVDTDSAGVGDARGVGDVPCLHPLALAPAPGSRLAPLDPDAPFAELFTSGTTGEAKTVAKSLAPLECEVSVLEATFGADIGPGARFFATASNQHLYGLLFRLLWPLSSGRPFQAETFLHVEELLPRMEEAGPVVLVSTPAHLRRARGLERVRTQCREVFSSGAPLDAETAAAVAAARGRAPIEVFGSTETGGVGWRRQTPGAAPGPFAPLPGVRVSVAAGGEEAGRLVVESPFLRAGLSGDARFTMGDLGEVLADGSFRALGRADRVVKVGEKRLSLPEMESELRSHPFVCDAVLAPLERRGETRLGAAVVPSEVGARALAEGGRRRFQRELATHLGARFDRVLLPRSWRTVERLPRDERGKTSRELVRALFDRPPPRAPRILEERRCEGEVRWRCEVPVDLAQLEGHFEGFPVVPGVAQLGWVIAALEAGLGARPRLLAIEALKYREVLRPRQRFTLAVSWSPEADRARFELAHEGRVFASGRLVLEVRRP